MMNRIAALLLGLILAMSVWTLWPKASTAITNGAAAPDFVGENWLNSKPLTIRGLQGRVVLVEFWTYG
jgi:hypothetical protein